MKYTPTAVCRLCGAKRPAEPRADFVCKRCQSSARYTILPDPSLPTFDLDHFIYDPELEREAEHAAWY